MTPRSRAFVLGAITGLAACRNREGATVSPRSTVTPGSVGRPVQPVPSKSIPRIEASPEAVRIAEQTLENAAARSRKMSAALTFDEFKATVYREPFEGGKYIVNGDTAVLNEKQLREFYENEVKVSPPARLVLAQVSGMDAKWNDQQKRNLSYCVSTTFGSRHDDVVQQMAAATGEWEKVAAVHYVHEASQDASCDASNEAVVFDVRPVAVGSYLARAFFPNEPRAARNVLIDESSFYLEPGEKLQLVGILRHELGHTIGFRHEHTRPEAKKCYEDADWVPLTSYDAFSVMHYPQCNGKGDWSLNLTDRDKAGAACVYGPNPPFKVDKTLVFNIDSCRVDQPAPSGMPQKETFKSQSVPKAGEKQYGPFAVAAGSQFEAKIGGGGASGDPDLYVRFDSKPAVNKYDCRPYLDGPSESCSLVVPSNAMRAFVMVRGYSDGTYDLDVSHISAP